MPSAEVNCFSLLPDDGHQQSNKFVPTDNCAKSTLIISLTCCVSMNFNTVYLFIVTIIRISSPLSRSTLEITFYNEMNYINLLTYS